MKCRRGIAMRKLSVRLSVRLSICSSVRLSVRPSVCQTRALWQNGRKICPDLFSSKIALSLKKVCYKVSLCENYQRQSCKAFIGLTIRAKMIGGGDPFYLKFWIKLTALERESLSWCIYRSCDKVQMFYCSVFNPKRVKGD